MVSPYLRWVGLDFGLRCLLKERVQWPSKTRVRAEKMPLFSASINIVYGGEDHFDLTNSRSASPLCRRRNVASVMEGGKEETAS